MAQPPSYERQKNFADDFGNETDHSALNAELDRASNSINDIRANLAIIQADDGKIRASSITTDSLDQEVLDYVQAKALAGANAVADAATAIARDAETKAEQAIGTAVEAAETAGLAVEKADRAMEASGRAVEKAEQALTETAQIDSRVDTAVTEALEGVDITGLNAVTIRNALGYIPYDGETNGRDFATTAEVQQAVAAKQVNADWNAKEGKAQILNKPGDFEGATSGTAGTQGLVPAPKVGDENKVLKGDGTWGAVASRNIGETVLSLLPITDAGLHLLDGALLPAGGIYDDFIAHVASFQADVPNLFASEEKWQTAVKDCGSCGKFVYKEGVSLRLPKVSDLLQGTTDVSRLGSLVEAGLPNITGGATSFLIGGNKNSSGVFKTSYGTGNPNWNISENGSEGYFQLNFSASDSNSIYGKSDTVQPQVVRGLLYIVVATSSKTEVEVNIDNIATDLNGKVDRDLTNLGVQGKERVTNLAMPSDKSVDLTLSASGANYIAPADGWIQIRKAVTNAMEFVEISVKGGLYTNNYCPYSLGNIALNAEVKKGQSFIVGYNASGETMEFKFIYAEGSRP